MVISDGFNINPFYPQRLARVVAPIFMLNGFYIKGTSYTFNVDGTNSRTDLNTQFVVIKDGTGTVIGCTTALLA